MRSLMKSNSSTKQNASNAKKLLNIDIYQIKSWKLDKIWSNVFLLQKIIKNHFSLILNIEFLNSY